jgi:hypothetical protein
MRHRTYTLARARELDDVAPSWVAIRTSTRGINRSVNLLLVPGHNRKVTQNCRATCVEEGSITNVWPKVVVGGVTVVLLFSLAAVGRMAPACRWWCGGGRLCDLCRLSFVAAILSQLGREVRRLVIAQVLHAEQGIACPLPDPAIIEPAAELIDQFRGIYQKPIGLTSMQTALGLFVSPEQPGIQTLNFAMIDSQLVLVLIELEKSGLQLSQREFTANLMGPGTVPHVFTDEVNDELSQAILKDAQRHGVQPVYVNTIPQ